MPDTRSIDQFVYPKQHYFARPERTPLHTQSNAYLFDLARRERRPFPSRAFSPFSFSSRTFRETPWYRERKRYGFYIIHIFSSCYRILAALPILEREGLLRRRRFGKAHLSRRGRRAWTTKNNNARRRRNRDTTLAIYNNVAVSHDDDDDDDDDDDRDDEAMVRARAHGRRRKVGRASSGGNRQARERTDATKRTPERRRTRSGLGRNVFTHELPLGKERDDHQRRESGDDAEEDEDDDEDDDDGARRK